MGYSPHAVWRLAVAVPSANKWNVDGSAKESWAGCNAARKKPVATAIAGATHMVAKKPGKSARVECSESRIPAKRRVNSEECRVKHPIAMKSATSSIPEGFSTITPYFAVPEADNLLNFLMHAFGAEVLHRHLRPDGKVAKPKPCILRGTVIGLLWVAGKFGSGHRFGLLIPKR